MLSVVIPVAPGDEEWINLLPDLRHLAMEDEVLFVSPEALAIPELPCAARLIACPAGRGRQLNAGARNAANQFLWFLHCDSRFTREALARLKDSLQRQPDALHFFDLRFTKGPMFMELNRIGVQLRSHLLRLPFGDQGLAMHRNLYFAFGPFKELLPYGEDHLFVWAAHHNRVPLRSVGATLSTSARKYREQGWCRNTGRNLLLTARQALPEFLKLLASRCR